MALLAAVVAAPFVNPDFASAKTAPRASPDQVHINTPLLDRLSTPFVQSSWPQTSIVRLQAVDQLHTNIAQFTNPIPFGPFDWSKAAKQQPQPDHPPYNLALLGTQVVAAPFSLDDFGKTFVPTSAPPQLLPRNPNLFSEVPFAGQVTSKPFDIPGSPVFATPLNLSLTAVIQSPFYQTDWSIAVRLKAGAPDQAARNPLIFSEVPFAQDDWTISKPIPRFAAPDRPYSILIYSEVPFDQSDWSKPSQPTAEKPVPPPNIIALLSGVPFAQLDWSKPQRLTGVLYPAPQPYNQNFYANPIPFSFDDFGKPIAASSLPPPPPLLNLSLTTVVVQSPFFLTDWSVTVRPRFSAPDQVARNPDIFSEVPFAQLDWSRPAAPVLGPTVLPPLNLSLTATFVQSPFYQTAWPAVTSPRIAPPLQLPLNVNLLTNPIPFAQFDYPAPRRAPATAPTPQPLNINLFTAAFVQMPFSQYDWTPARQPRAGVSPDLPNFALLVSVAPSAPAELHNHPFFATVGQLMGGM